MDIRSGYDVMLTYGDLHLPTADFDKLGVLTDIIADLQPDIILDGGDFLDGDSISNFNKSYEQLASLQDELELWQRWANKINNISPHSKKIVLKDNHFCKRLETLFTSEYWACKLTALNPVSLLKLDELGWDMVNEYVWKDSIMFLHGDGVGGGTSRCPVNKSRAMVKDVGYSVVKYHSHSTGFEVIEQTSSDKMAIQIGTFQSTQKAAYIKHAKTANWSTSAGIFYLSKTDNDYQFVPIIFLNNRTTVNGKLYCVDYTRDVAV
jgi:hypothetical protein